MNHTITKYPVQHPLLRNYVKFIWELKIEKAQLDHAIVPQRNISLRFNLSDTPQYCIKDKDEHRLENVNFAGLQDRNTNARLKLDGKVHVIGISFLPDGFFPFFNIPLREFRNEIVGAGETGNRTIRDLPEKIKDQSDYKERLKVIEDELLKILIHNNKTPDHFRMIFNHLKNCDNTSGISGFCKRNNMSVRSLERMFDKYIGVPASTYFMLNRFHHSLNQLLQNNFEKLSDLAFDNGYFDQMHFIRDFKRFAGDTPTGFVQQKNSILHIGKLS